MCALYRVCIHFVRRHALYQEPPNPEKTFRSVFSTDCQTFKPRRQQACRVKCPSVVRSAGILVALAFPSTPLTHLSLHFLTNSTAGQDKQWLHQGKAVVAIFVLSYDTICKAGSRIIVKHHTQNPEP